MKYYIILVLIIISSGSYCQNKNPKIVEEQILNKEPRLLTIITYSKNDLSTLNGAESVCFYFKNKKIEGIKFQFAEKDSSKFDFLKSTFQGYNKFYDLEFEADSILLNRIYPNIIVPKIPLISNRQFFGDIKNTNIKHDISSINIFKDSTIFIFTQDFEPKDRLVGAFHVKLQSNIKDLEKNITKRLDRTFRADSIIMELVISRIGKIESSKLIYGDNTNLFNSAYNSLIELAKWSPAIHTTSGRPIEMVKMRILVKTNKNGKVSIQLPNKLYNLTGD